MTTSVRNLLIGLIDLLGIPTILYLIGATTSFFSEWNFLFQILGIFFGMRGVFRLFHNRTMLETIHQLGAVRIVVSLGAFGIYIAALFQFDALFAETWVRNLATQWAGGICGGLVMQMIFNEHVLERYLQQNEIKVDEKEVLMP